MPFAPYALNGLAYNIYISGLLCSPKPLSKSNVSDLLNNATCGRFAEFVVWTSIGLKPENLRGEWGAYDLTTENRIKIEVKSAAYIQSWNQKKYSTISFSIKSARYWNAGTNIQHGSPKRYANSMFSAC